MNNSEVALIIIFNHRYDKNLPYLEEMYKDRFSNRYYLVPFYDGEQENVIPVYDRSVFFSGYIAQGANIFIKKEYKHYLFIADDMIIHPGINENTYRDFFEIDEHQSWIPYLRSFQDTNRPWNGTFWGMFYKKKQKWVEVDGELPPVDEAIRRFANQGVEIRDLTRKEIFGPCTFAHKSLQQKAFLVTRILTRLRHPFKNKYRMQYPLCGSYSDICCVSGDCIKKFAHYCGVFSATSLYVEVAVPSALVLASDTKLQSEKTTRHKGRAYWWGAGAFYFSEEDHMDRIEEKYSCLDDIMNNFPDDQLYIHPIKLSKWLKKNKK